MRILAQDVHLWFRTISPQKVPAGTCAWGLHEDMRTRAHAQTHTLCGLYAVCVCVCVCVCMYVCMHTHALCCLCCACVCVCMYACMYVVLACAMYVHVCAYVYAHAHMCAHTSVRCTCTYVCSVCMHVCARVRMYPQIPTHTHTQVHALTSAQSSRGRAAQPGYLYTCSLLFHRMPVTREASSPVSGRPGPQRIGGSVEERVVGVACGGSHTVAVTADGGVWTQGAAVHGVLGRGEDCRASPLPAPVRGGLAPVSRCRSIPPYFSVAVCMALHPRLGAASPLFIYEVPPDVLQYIVEAGEDAGCAGRGGGGRACFCRVPPQRVLHLHAHRGHAPASQDDPANLHLESSVSPHLPWRYHTAPLESSDDGSEDEEGWMGQGGPGGSDDTSDEDGHSSCGDGDGSGGGGGGRGDGEAGVGAEADRGGIDAWGVLSTQWHLLSTQMHALVLGGGAGTVEGAGEEREGGRVTQTEVFLDEMPAEAQRTERRRALNRGAGRGGAGAKRGGRMRR